MKIELKIGEKVYEIANIVETPYTKVINETSVNGINRTLVARSDNRFFLNMKKSMMFNTKCDSASILQYGNKGQVVREITLNGCEIKSATNNSIEIECRTWEDKYEDVIN